MPDHTAYVLNPRNKLIWERREAGQTLQSIAEEFGINRERVRQIHLNVTRRIRFALNAKLPCANPYAYDTWHEFGPGEEWLHPNLPKIIGRKSRQVRR